MSLQLSKPSSNFPTEKHSRTSMIWPLTYPYPSPLCSSSGMIPMWCVYLSSRLVWLVTKMMTIGPENMDHENNDPAVGQASIPAILFWEQNIPKLPNIQDVYCCTSTLHCQTPLWCALLLSSEAPLPAYAKVLTSGKKKKQLSFSASSKFAKRFNNRPEI